MGKGARGSPSRGEMFPVSGKMSDMLPLAEAAGLAEEVRRLFDDLDQQHESAARGLAGEYAPPMDVIERHDRVEIVLDVAGVTAEDLRILFKNGTLIIAGCKWPVAPPSTHDSHAAAFHLVERGFGRFVRVAQIAAAIDVTACRATLRQGELVLTLPKLNGGREVLIPIEKAV